MLVIQKLRKHVPTVNSQSTIIMEKDLVRWVNDGWANLYINSKGNTDKTTKDLKLTSFDLLLARDGLLSTGDSWLGTSSQVAGGSVANSGKMLPVGSPRRHPLKNIQ